MPVPRKKTYVRSSPVCRRLTPRPVSKTVSPRSGPAVRMTGSSKSRRSHDANAAAGR